MLHLLHITEHFCLPGPTEMPWSSSDWSPAAPCTLPANNPVGASFGRGQRDLPEASQHPRRCAELVQGHWGKIPGVLWRLEMPPRAALGEMQLSLTPLISLKRVWEMLVRGFCCWEGVNFSL